MTRFYQKKELHLQKYEFPISLDKFLLFHPSGEHTCHACNLHHPFTSTNKNSIRDSDFPPWLSRLLVLPIPNKKIRIFCYPVEIRTFHKKPIVIIQKDGQYTPSLPTKWAPRKVQISKTPGEIRTFPKTSQTIQFGLDIFFHNRTVPSSQNTGHTTNYNHKHSGNSTTFPPQQCSAIPSRITSSMNNPTVIMIVAESTLDLEAKKTSESIQTIIHP